MNNLVLKFQDKTGSFWTLVPIVPAGKVWTLFSDMYIALLGIVKGWWPAPSGESNWYYFLISGTPRLSLSTLPLPVLGDKLFVLLIVALGDYNSVVKHLYFSILPPNIPCLLFEIFHPFVSKLLPFIAYVDAQKGQSHRDLIFQMKQFKSNGPQTPLLWVILNNVWVRERKRNHTGSKKSPVKNQNNWKSC